MQWNTCHWRGRLSFRHSYIRTKFIKNTIKYLSLTLSVSVYFQNSTQTWDAEVPDFTPCFERTVLVWVPCGLLWLLSPAETLMLLRSNDRFIPWTVLNVCKYVSVPQVRGTGAGCGTVGRENIYLQVHEMLSIVVGSERRAIIICSCSWSSVATILSAKSYLMSEIYLRSS